MNAFISHSNLLTPYGLGIDALWHGLLSHQTAIRPTQQFADRNFPTNQAGTIPNLEIQPNQSRIMAMLTPLLTPLIATLDPQTPLLLATTVGEIEYLEQSLLTNNPALAHQSRPEHLLQKIKQLLHLQGQATIISSACASSSAALTRAASLLRHTPAKQILLITADALSEFVYSGFSSLLSLSEQPAKPFDAHRTGLTLGEAAAYALISSDQKQNENATQLLGWGNTTDATHMTAPDRTASGLSRAISKALTMAHKKPADISLIAAHGTATPYSDAMEFLAFQKSLPHPIPTFSIKGAIGHPLAAAGLVQILLTARALAEQLLPPTIGLTTPGPSALAWTHTTPQKIPPHALALSTNSGFGGINTALLLTHTGASQK